MSHFKVERSYGQLVYTRESLTSEYGVALYDYERCEPIADFPGNTWEEMNEAYQAMDRFVAGWGMEFVDY